MKKTIQTLPLIIALIFITAGCIHQDHTPYESKWTVSVFLPYSNVQDDGEYKILLNGDDYRLDPINDDVFDENSYVEVPIGGLTLEVTFRSTQFKDNPVIHYAHLIGYYCGWSTETAAEFTRIY